MKKIVPAQNTPVRMCTKRSMSIDAVAYVVRWEGEAKSVFQEACKLREDAVLSRVAPACLARGPIATPYLRPNPTWNLMHGNTLQSTIRRTRPPSAPASRS